MKRYLAILGAAMFCVACFSLYLMMESVSTGNRVFDGQVLDLNKNAGPKSDPVLHFIGKSYNGTKKDVVSVPQKTCSFSQSIPPKTDIQMLDVFDQLAFDNPRGGVWTQGFPISYSQSRWNQRPLKVFVVPHSHNDPGWLKTFERYYSDQTRFILNYMVEKLVAYPKMRFIYAEMSFFSMWWKEISKSQQETVKMLLRENRLEIVSGGWVMTDEANAHYFAMLDQMIEGNQWLLNQVGVTPESSWAIDPFGHTSTMAYLLKNMGFHNMLIQRIHYSIKKQLASNQQLEFMWRQNWDHAGDTDILCHMMPFYSYDVPHTCGPDPQTCCQFDFKRLPGGRISCPWKIPPQPVTESNIEERASTLLDQYRKKSTMYRSDVVLVPLGDDFRYDKGVEWDQQYNNYQALFDYMNGRQDWHVEAQFGTLSDYFKEVYSRSGVEVGQKPPEYPVLSGDFFTYADRDDHYWSGYFTSRPFYKRLDRELEAHLRGAEIIYSLAVANSRHKGINYFPEAPLMKQLVNARRNLGLFQHHDAITGTAKDPVVVDYGMKLLTSLMDMKQVMGDSAHYLLMADKSKYTFTPDAHFFNLDEQRASHDSLPEKTVVQLNSEARPVVFYNSLTHTRKAIVRLYVSELHVEITNSDGQVIASQADPFWISDDTISRHTYKVAFAVTVPALGLSTYNVRSVLAGSNKMHGIAALTLYNAPLNLNVNDEFSAEKRDDSSFEIKSSDIKAKFSADTGTIQELTLNESGDVLQTQVKFMSYGVTSSKEKSGAYLFLPDGPAQPLLYSKPYMRVVRGPIVSEVQSFMPLVQHTVSLYNSPGIDSLSVDIHNIVDIRTQGNRELVMRVETGVNNKDREFFTDLNGYQIQRRKTLDKLPLQANYYPMPGMAYLENDSTRFTILSGQSLGVASLQQGWLEIMQDRRLNQDDNRGLAQPVNDNKRTPNRFKLLVEKRAPGAKMPPSQAAGYLSLLGHMTSQELIHPIVTLPVVHQDTSVSQILPQFTPLAPDMSCDLHMVNLRTMQNIEDNADLVYRPKDKMGLILHRLGVDCTFPAKGLLCPMNDGQVTLVDLFKDFTVASAQSSSLSLIHDSTDIAPTSLITIPPMEIKAYKVHLK